MSAPYINLNGIVGSWIRMQELDEKIWYILWLLKSRETYDDKKDLDINEIVFVRYDWLLSN